MERMYGVKLYDPQYCTKGNLDLMEQCGFNTVFLGRGALSKGFTEELTRRSFFWNIVEPVFLLDEDDPSPLATLKDGSPAESSWVRFACPTDENHLRHVRERIRDDISQYDPPGVSLDFIRFFQFWEITDPASDASALPASCFCERCTRQRRAFRSITHWRQGVIDQTAALLCSDIRTQKYGTKIGIHCVPWTRDMFDGAIEEIIGQNFNVLSDIGDYITPMIYHHMMRLDSSYVRTFMDDVTGRGCKNVLPSVQVRQAYREDEMGPDEFAAALHLALEAPSMGVVLYKWEDLASDERRLDIVRKELKGS